MDVVATSVVGRLLNNATINDVRLTVGVEVTRTTLCLRDVVGVANGCVELTRGRRRQLGTRVLHYRHGIYRELYALRIGNAIGGVLSLVRVYNGVLGTRSVVLRTSGTVHFIGLLQRGFYLHRLRRAKGLKDV